MPTQAKWYFDFVSPYAYLQFKRLNQVPSSLDYEMVPILFAGLLKHWQHKGPAEIDPKRIDTYRHCQWLAEDLGIAFRLPQAHPFNPLPYLRLCIALGSAPEVIGAIFDYIWTEAPPVHSKAGIKEIARRLEIDDLGALLDSPQTKKQLRANTERAIAAGVYGVPTFVVGTERFWGLDQMEMLSQWLAKPDELAHIATENLSKFPTGL
jgi:2-hydroxychromene-2-carboxylate isomerase